MFYAKSFHCQSFWKMIQAVDKWKILCSSVNFFVLYLGSFVLPHPSFTICMCLVDNVWLKLFDILNLEFPTSPPLYSVFYKNSYGYLCGLD